jgi:hypothetical protein
VTVKEVPTALLEKVPVAPLVFRVTASFPITPAGAALAVLSVADVFPSQGLLFAVIPVTVKVFRLIVPLAVCRCTS